MSEFEAGKRVEWVIQNTRKHGTIISVEPAEESLHVDEMMGREPGDSLRDYGHLCRIQCDDVGCQCNTSDWLHGANECQLTDAEKLAPAFEGMLF